MKPLLYVMDTELSALYGLFNDILNIESVSSTHIGQTQLGTKQHI